MPEPSLFNGLGTTLVECFSLASMTSFFTQLRQRELPKLRVLIATGIYTGFSACAFASVWINYYGMEKTTFLYFASIASGLGTADMLSAIWAKVLPSVVNYAWRKFTGEDLISINIERDEPPSVENHNDMPRP